MRVKVTIETWNDEWHLEIEDKEDGETLNAGYYPTFKQCVSECNRYLSQLSAAEQCVHTDPPSALVSVADSTNTAGG
jgi:hypothetical protein